VKIAVLQAIWVALVVVLGVAAATPAPHDALWRLSVGASAYGTLLAPLAFLPLLAWRPGDGPWLWVGCAVGTALLVAPFVRVLPLARALPDQLEAAFGPTRCLGDAPCTASPLRVAGLLPLGPPRSPVAQHDFAPGLTLDLYHPGGPRPPVVVVVHGGSWQRGDSTQLAPLNHYLAARGVAVAALNYRKAPESPFPAARDDVLTGLRWLRDNAADLGLDMDRVVLLGRSAGGQLALSAARETEVPLAGLVLFYPPLDLVWSWANPAPLRGYDSHATLRLYLGDSLAAAPERYRRASPLLDLQRAPPTLIVHGDADQLVSLTHSTRLASRLEELGVPHLLVRVPGGKHGLDVNFSGAGAQVSTFAIDRFVASILE
jgi:acetyl esterase/lipase